MSLVCAAVIRLRCALERAFERRWVGPVVLAAVIVLLAFVGFHLVADHFEEAAAATCGGILIVTFAPRIIQRSDAPSPEFLIATNGPAGPTLPSVVPVGVARSLPQTPLRR
jgi:hypothetical protein